MTNTFMGFPDEMLHISLMGGEARALLCRTTTLCQTMANIHAPSPTACAAMSRLLSGTAMLGVMMKGKGESVTVNVVGNGTIGTMTCVAHGGNVKVTAHYPQNDVPPRADGHLDVGGLVGKEGRLTVIKDLAMDRPYVGQVNLVSGEIAMDFAQYFTVSEQTPSLVALGTRVHEGMPLSSGGILIQAMPGCSEETLSQLEIRSMLFIDISVELAHDSLETLVDFWFKGLEPEIIGRTPLAWQCDCSREKMAKALITVGKKDLEEMIEEDGEATLTCHFCKSSHHFDKPTLQEMLEKAQV